MRKLVYLYSFPPMLLVQVLFLYHQELAFPSVLKITFQTLFVIDGKQSAAFTVFGVYQVCRQSPHTLQLNLFCPGPASSFGFFSHQSLVCLHWEKAWGARGFVPPENACNHRPWTGRVPAATGREQLRNPALSPWGQETHLRRVH